MDKDAFEKHLEERIKNYYVLMGRVGNTALLNQIVLNPEISGNDDKMFKAGALWAFEVLTKENEKHD